MANAIVILGVTLTCAAVLLNILALSLNYWEKRAFVTKIRGGISNNMRDDAKSVLRVFDKSKSLTIRYEIRWGLWEVCTKREEQVIDCSEYEPNSKTEQGEKLMLVRAALFLATFALAGSATCMFLKLSVMKEKQKLIHAAWILSLAGGLLSLCAFAIYTTLKRPDSDYMIAFHMAILAWIVAWAATGFVFAASRKKDDIVVM